MNSVDIREYQNQKLHEVVKIAYEKKDFYRERFDVLGIRPEEVYSLDDLGNFFLTREDFEKNTHDKLIRKDLDKTKLIKTHTSGSTRQALDCYKTFDELMSVVSDMEMTFERLGTTKEKSKLLMMVPRGSSAWQSEPVFKKGGFNPKFFAPSEFYAELLKENGVWYSYTGLHALTINKNEKEIEEIRRRNEINIVGCASTGDYEPIPSREYVEHMLGLETDFLNSFGNIESFRVISMTCEKRREHILEKNVIPEINKGEFTITTLDEKRAQPLIRYGVGDRGELEKCDCGMDGRAIKIYERIIPDEVTKHVRKPYIYGALVASDAFLVDKSITLDFGMEIKKDIKGVDFIIYVKRARPDINEEKVSNELKRLLVYGRKDKNLDPAFALQLLIEEMGLWNINFKFVNEIPEQYKNPSGKYPHIVIK